MRAFLPIFIATLAVAGAAQAHPKLVASVPAANGQAGHVHEVRLTFNEPVTPAFSGLAIKGPDGKAVAVGKGGLDPKDKKTLVTPLPAGLAPGAYEVTWHAVASDTHRIQGSYRFSVK
jgi:copper resistance protein C